MKKRTKHIIGFDTDQKKILEEDFAQTRKKIETFFSQKKKKKQNIKPNGICLLLKV